MLQDDIEQLLRPSIESLGYELWGIEYLAQGKHSLLRIYIDQSSGIGIEDCEQVSVQVSAILDVENPITGNYSLEVSSPGVPRPLFYPNQYSRYVNQPVNIKIFKPINGQRKFTGIIVSSNEQAVTLEVEQKQLEFLFSNIVKANLTVE